MSNPNVKNREITEEVQQSYLEYAMSTIIDRALPDVRDGLKPVHRRILYSMQEMGLRPNAKYQKSAKVVGHTMGNYHPHGDQAIYDSLARMAQNFSLRYPLVDGQGNFGSIDGDSPAAMRYCVTGKTRIVTEKGLLEIEKVVESKSSEKNINLKILSFQKKIHAAVKWFHSGKHKTKRIVTAKGFSVEGTHNHPLMVWADNPITKIPHVKWKLMEEIKKGDFLIIDRSSDLWPKYELSSREYYPRGLSARADIKILPKHINEDLGHILGSLVSEGTIKEKELEFCNSDRKWINDFKIRWGRVFPDCRLHEFNRNPSSYGKLPYQTLEIHSRCVIEFLKNIGLTPAKSADKEIPEVIFRSPKHVVASFLRAYFEGDGSVSFSSKMNELSCCSVSENLISQTQLLLLRFGILSAKRFDSYRKIHKLYIRDLSNYRLFGSEIGFISTRKTKKLAALVDRILKNYSQTDFVPFLRESVYQYLTSPYGRDSFTRKHNFDRYGMMEANFEKVILSIESDNREKIRSIFENLLSMRYAYDPVVEISDQGFQDVYSIKVDSNCHSFVGNGFINHNTEARLAPISEPLLADIDKDTVNFRDNYDGSHQEPAVLPTRVPNLLINGAMGIAVGMATNIPPHNLGEVLDAMTFLIDNDEADIKELMQFVKGPDFPTGGTIYNEHDITNAYATGRGPIIMRGVAEIIEKKPARGGSASGGAFQIIVTEIPYQVNKAELIKHIAELVMGKERKIDGIKDIRDESDKEGLRIAIDLKQDAFPRKVLNQLFKYTELQKAFHFNMLALVDGIQPQILGLKGMLEKFIDHRKEVVTRRSRFELQKAKDRAHILEGLKKALDHIDEVIKIIRAAASRDEASSNLIKKFKFSDKQAAAILDMRLSALVGLERKKLQDELDEKLKLTAYLEDLLRSPKKILGVVKDEFKEIRQQYADERRTKVIKSALKEIGEEELIPEENSLFMITQDGYIKRMAPDVLKAQKRGGKGLIGMATKEEDIISHFFLANTHDSILFFTNSGKVFQTKGYEVPESSRQAKGKAIANFLQVTANDQITAVVPIPKGQKRMYLFMATDHGIIKKVDMDAFEKVRSNGMVAIKLKSDDRLGWVLGTSGDDQIVMTTSDGNAIRFKEKDVRPMGRGAAGVIGVRLEKGARVVGADIIPSGAEKGLFLLALMENGYGKRTELRQYKTQKRGGHGIMTAKITTKTGNLVSAHVTSEENKEIIAVSRKGQVIRTAIGQISIIGRATQGVRVMRLDSSDKLASVVVS